ncbi:MAG: HpsJ family protein [Kastovskya adunca ATA6-11-RM4]|jgi:hypothetical protein|nr:HpsJ family protein [Kastovskya adunca ATA6-11-RM4]
MKATTSPTNSSFTALTLKVVGLIMILSSLIDFILLAIPFNPLQREWQLSWTTQVVDRGIIPMVGIALLLAGYWISSNAAAVTERKSGAQDLRFWVLLLSSLLGLLYLLLVPLHLNNIRLASTQALEQINQRATQEEGRIQTESQQINTLIQDNQRLSELDQAIASGQVQGEQLQRLQAIRQQIEAIKKDPQALNQQVEAAQTQLRSRRLEAEKQARASAFKLGLRTGLSSLLLAIGYIAVGWTGLRSLKSSSQPRRKV